MLSGEQVKDEIQHNQIAPLYHMQILTVNGQLICMVNLNPGVWESN